MGVAKTGRQALCCRHRLGTESRIAWRARRRACGARLALCLPTAARQLMPACAAVLREARPWARA
eukprot:5288633-Pyramimonas_sp.AAC.1